MQKRPMGRSGLFTAPLVLGGNVFGWTADERVSFEILDRFVDAGLDTIDTADIYSAWKAGNVGGESEEIIGNWMQQRGNRDRVQIVTKVGFPLPEWTNGRGLSETYIFTAVDQSLRRLRTDYIDLYLSHWPDDATPHQETLECYAKLKRQGKIRAVGASNFDAGRLAASLKVARDASLPRYDVLQPEYNLYDRSSFEGPLRKLCIAEDIGVITYHSLAKGFLSGKYASEADLAISPRGKDVKAYFDQRGRRILRALDTIASKHAASPAEVALAWLMADAGVTAPIASATSRAQVDSLIRAVTLTLSADELLALNQAGGSFPGNLPC